MSQYVRACVCVLISCVNERLCFYFWEYRFCWNYSQDKYILDLFIFRHFVPIELTHYRTTNFRLFQTERVCRGHLQIGQKWKKVIQTGRKDCGKRRNCSLRAISPFPTVFSKGLFPRGVKRCHCVGMGEMNLLDGVYLLTHSHTMTPFDAPGKQGFWKHCGKRRNCS